jgi:hypothetical protein
LPKADLPVQARKFVQQFFTPRLFYNLVFSTRGVQLIQGSATTDGQVVEWKEGAINDLIAFIPLAKETLKVVDEERIR